MYSGISFSSLRLRQRFLGEPASLARPTYSGWQHRAWASSDRLSSNPAARRDGLAELWSGGYPANTRWPSQVFFLTSFKHPKGIRRRICLEQNY
jgi:hypothetical protein